MPERQSPRGGFCYTWNNFPASALENIKAFCEDPTNQVDICFFQEERGESGTPHLQGYIKLKGRHKKRWNAIQAGFGSNTIHMEKQRGSLESNIEYCLKEDSRVEGGLTYEFYSNPADKPESPEIPRGLDSERLYMYQQELEKMYIDERLNADALWSNPETRAEQERYDRQIHWVWERDGNVGKTSFAKYMCRKYPNSIKVDGAAKDIKHAILSVATDKSGTFNRRKFPKLVIWNIVRSQLDDEGGARISWKAVEEIKDAFFFSPKYEGGMVNENPPFILMFANQAPPLSELSADRWKVHEIICNGDNDFIFLD